MSGGRVREPGRTVFPAFFPLVNVRVPLASSQFHSTTIKELLAAENEGFSESRGACGDVNVGEFVLIGLCEVQFREGSGVRPHVHTYINHGSGK